MDPNRFEEWRECFIALLGRTGIGPGDMTPHEAATMAEYALEEIAKRRPVDPCPPIADKQDVIAQLPADEMSAGSIGWP